MCAFSNAIGDVSEITGVGEARIGFLLEEGVDWLDTGCDEEAPGLNARSKDSRPLSPTASSSIV
jgi:hypothetical protein